MRDHFGPADFKGEWTGDRRVIFKKRPVEPWQSMPIGTGKIGATVWAPSGLMLQINHSDHFAPDGGVPGLLRLAVDLDGEPFKNNISWEQELKLDDASVNITAHTGDGDVKVRLIAHKGLDVISIVIDDMRNEPGNAVVTAYQWRQDPSGYVNGNVSGCGEINRFSAFDVLNRMTGVTGTYEDPLTGMSYAAVFTLASDQVSTRYNMIAETGKSRRKHILTTVETGKNESLGDVFARAEDKLRRAAAISPEEIYAGHTGFWENFWQQSRIDLKESSKLQPLRAAWYMQRYYTASSMDGAYPPKFNGSIFLYHFDSRPWGGFYVHQNVRLQYWPLLKSGDHGYMMQYFNMMMRALDHARDRVRAAYGHGGAVFFESMYFWGAPVFNDLREGEGFVCKYHLNHWTASLELLMMMLEYHRYTGDGRFAAEMLLPLGEEIIDFFYQHNPIKERKLFLEKQNALETWWECDDPADQVAGLRAVLPRLFELACTTGSAKPALLEKWRKYLNMLPELPRGKMLYEGTAEQGRWLGSEPGSDILPALAIHHSQKMNTEDPELYSVWPFGLFGDGMPGLDDAISTFRNKIYKRPRQGWNQHAIWAARLGLKDEAAALAMRHFEYNAMCPGGMFTSVGGSYPGRPDVPECPFFDSPGTLAIAVNEMLMQDHTGEVRILPAWPDDEKENVSFKLHAAGGRIVQI